MYIDYETVLDIRETFLPLLIGSLHAIDPTDATEEPYGRSGQH